MSNIWDTLDYKNDAIIEASAGTGKTYTLQQIVLKLVKDKNIPIESILLVTFTKKAAGELRDRIRAILEKNGGVPQNFDEMTIGTIHSFCQDLLREYAFENGVQMQMNAGDGKDLLNRAILNTLKSKEFGDQYGQNFQETLDWFNTKNISGIIAHVTERLNGKNGGVPSPAQIESKYNTLGKNFSKVCSEFEQDIGISVEQIKENDDINKYILSKDFKIQCNSSAYAAYRIFISNIAELKKDFKKGKIQNNENEAQKLNPNNTKRGENKQSFFDFNKTRGSKINEMNNTVLEILKLRKDFLFSMFAQEHERLKNEESYLTYDDMIQKTAAIVKQEKAKGEGNSSLLKKIRERYCIALVDEFQDTDGEQWTIFNTLFSCTNNRGGFLLVVGDPKQAIYSFRGADIKTYVTARDEIRGRIGNSPQNNGTLDTTYRSTKPMVDAFNKLFPSGGWFPQKVKIGEGDEKEIAYKEVKYPEVNEKLDKKTGTENPVCLLESFPHKGPDDFHTDCSNSVYFKTFATNAAKEILKLKSEGLNKGSNVSLNYGDFCFLIRGHKEEPVIKKALAKYNIPFTVYKEGGLYNSLEAESVLALFDFLSKPQKSGNLAALLLTPFFGHSPADLQALRADEEKAGKFKNDFYQDVEKWQFLVEKRQWAQLFHTIMTETEIARPKKGDFDFDRRWTAFQQIFDELLAQCDKKALSITDFANTLRTWAMDSAKADEGTALRQKENDEDRVKIMTMHVSKGLEFPVVFIPYGVRPISDGMDFNEEQRLLYVAITRAIYRVYLPWTKAEFFRENGFGSKNSALVIAYKEKQKDGEFKTKVNPNGFLGKAILDYLAYFHKQPKEFVIDHYGSSLDPATNDGNETKGKAADAPLEKPSDPPTFLKPENALPHWDSYTSLTHHGSKQEAKVLPNAVPGNEADEADVSMERQREQDERETNGSSNAETALQPSALPRGTTSGTVFHEIMEALCNGENGLDFSIAKRDFCEITQDDAPFVRLIERTMRKNGLENRQNGGMDTVHALAKIVWAALNTEISIGGTSFRLKDIPREDRAAEVDFVISEQTVLESSSREGAFNGSIDLIVKVNDKYFILDWKTNSLPDYGTETVKTAMNDANYHLQYQLYTLEAEKWLGPGSVAGVAYLFVRGGETGTAAGLFTQEVDDAKRTEYLKALQDICK